MRFVSIASGSSGNCIYVGSETSHILVDAGSSARRIEQGLNEIGIKGTDLDGIFITHEHSDHIRGLGVLARKFQTPIYGTRETLEEIGNTASLGLSLIHIFNDIERIGDHCENLAELSQEKKNGELIFSQEAAQEMEALIETVKEAVTCAIGARKNHDMTLVRQALRKEEEVDSQEEELRENHMKQMCIRDRYSREYGRTNKIRE